MKLYFFRTSANIKYVPSVSVTQEKSVAEECIQDDSLEKLPNFLKSDVPSIWPLEIFHAVVGSKKYPHKKEIIEYTPKIRRYKI